MSTTTRNWNQYQQAIFETVREGEGHTFVSARAGTGKTTTIVEALRHVPAGNRTLLMAFNGAIATELRARAPRETTVLTFHSFGLRAVGAAFGRPEVDGDKVIGEVARRLDFEKPEERAIGYAVSRAASLAKGTLAKDEEEIGNLIDAFGILDASEVDDGAFDRVVSLTADMLVWSRGVTNVIDFDDMIWLPLTLGLRIPTYDRVFIDEAQDLNGSQIAISLKAVKRGGRIVAVGDDRQAIYTFRGADSEAVSRIVNELEAKTLPLSTTYRCGKAICREVQRIVPDFQAADSNPEGIVRYETPEKMVEQIRGGDFLLSRTNAPLVGYCLGFLRQGRKAKIAGKDVGTGLVSFVKALRPKGVDGLIEKTLAWKDKEVARLMKRNKPADAAIDKSDTILAFCDGAKSVPDVIARIEDLFANINDDNAIVCSTTHKAKGLERERVFMLKDTYKPGKSVEEDNLFYVAATRAKSELVYVTQKAVAS
jgi:superfamily I DNA/RNA helicase